MDSVSSLFSNLTDELSKMKIFGTFLSQSAVQSGENVVHSTNALSCNERMLKSTSKVLRETEASSFDVETC